MYYYKCLTANLFDIIILKCHDFEHSLKSHQFIPEITAYISLSCSSIVMLDVLYIYDNIIDNSYTDHCNEKLYFGIRIHYTSDYSFILYQQGFDYNRTRLYSSHKTTNPCCKE